MTNLWKTLAGLFKVAKEPALDLSQEIHPGTKGASAFDKKRIEEDMIPYLNALNLQGSEEDIKNKIREEINKELEKAGASYKEDNIEWLVSTIYGAWRASQPVPAEVGSEGESNVGVANTQGTGVYVEPMSKKACDFNPWREILQKAVDMDFGSEADLKEFDMLSRKFEHMTDVVKNASPELITLLRTIKDLVGGYEKFLSGDSNFPSQPKAKMPPISMNKEAAVGADDIAKGVLVELEHTQKDKSRPATPEEAAAAKKIAEEHLAENKQYYDDTKLAPAGEERLVTEAELGIIARISQKEDGWHVYAETGKHLGGPYESKEAAQKRLQQVEMFKHMSSLEGTMNFEAGEVAVLNNRVGHLTEGTEVTVTAFNDGEVTFVADTIHGITKASNLDKITLEAGRPFGDTDKEMWCTTCAKVLEDQDAVDDCYKANHTVEILKKLKKEAAWTNCTSCGGKEISPRCMNCDGLGRMPLQKEAADTKMEKYQWDNEDLKSKFALGDCVRVGSFDVDGVNYKGKEGTIREKVMVSCGDSADMFYLVELAGCGSITLPADVLSKISNTRALNRGELEKEAVLRPNFDVVQDFLNSYDHPPTVVTTEDIEAFLQDPKNNYQWTKRDLKEIIKYLQSARVEVRVPVQRETPELPEAQEPAMAKTAVKYKWTSPDGKQSHEVDHPDDMGPEYTVKDPTSGQDKKYTKASLAICSDCSGEGVINCECMEDANIWMSAEECDKCKDYGTLPCKCSP